MKILAIRGQNLASLEATFSIDLADGPLGRAGLFAITGPTGAGKSTLLDAVCLCLFDATPRLAQRGGSTVVLPGQDRDDALPANDQRNILRRGAASAWAEVDFRGRDGRIWTARWEVHRARKRADGRVQSQSLTLRDDAGHAVGGTKTETLDAIRDKVGLDFDQFRRSVLLAQGDFAAFLRANENERAELLEQMTGTRIYTRLSQAAFFEKKRLDGERRELATRLDAQGVLDADARAAAEARLATATADRAEARKTADAAEAAVRWHQQHDALNTAVAEATKGLEAATAALQAAAERRDALRRAEASWGLRDVARQADAAATASKAGQDAQAVAATALEQRERAWKQDQRALAMAHAALARAHQARLTQLEGRLDAATQGRDDAQAWLDAHPDHERFADDRQVAQLQARVQRRVDLAQRLAKASAAVTTLEQDLATASAQAQAAEKGRADADLAEQQAATAVAQARTRADATDEDSLGRRRALLERQDKALGELGRLVEKATALDAAVAQAATQAADAGKAADAATAAADAARARSAELGLRLDEARTTLRRAQAAVDAESMRSALEPDQPCPVCGSPDHPWADGSPVAALHEEQKQRVDQLQQEQRKADTDAAAQAAAAKAATEQKQAADKAGADAARARADLDEPWSRWQDALTQPAGPDGAGADGATDAPLLADALPAPADAADAVATLRVTLDQRLQALQAAEARQRTLRRQLDDAVKQHQAAQAAARKQADALAAANAAVLKAQAGLADARQRVASLQQEGRQLDLDLAEALDPADGQPAAVPDWRDLLDQPADLVAACRKAGQDFARQRARRQQADDAIGQLKERIAQDRREAERAVAAAAAEDLVAAPAVAPPGGLHPPQLTDWHDTRVQALTHQLTQAQQALESSTTQATAAREALAAASAKAAALAQTAADARRRLDEARAAVDLDDAALAWLLALPEGWVQTERAALVQLEDAPKQAATLLAERRQRLDAHLQTRPDLDAAPAAAALADAAKAQVAADEAWGAARAVLQADDGARARVAELRQQLEAHDLAAAPWLQLADCIGSGSGVEFKRFAQSLTLELLLEQANHHLRDLQPRYSLARIGGTDLDLLVVDHDLGDEPRTVQSLSGGEGFLTSLALALGLSSLSSRDVRVESLFIDEGFGTLDARTLDTALSVLDSLQASGRQVGVISHVGGLAERIGLRVAVEPLGGGRSRVQVVES